MILAKKCERKILAFRRHSSNRHSLFSYVLSVYVGDFLLVQCTLHSESTALQAMHFLRGRVELTQVRFKRQKSQLLSAR